MSRNVEQTNNQIKYRKDYQPCDYKILKTNLHFMLGSDATIVTSELQFSSNNSGQNTPLRLNGELLNLEHISIDGQLLSSKDYQYQDDILTLNNPPTDNFVLKTVVRINPEANTALSGLYLSNGKFCTQCEAEGFRRITFYLDRPDILSVFTTTICADKKQFPHLLSNGNLQQTVDLENGLIQVTWHDPYPKPSYLFALVAGDFDLLRDSFKTMNGREVALHLYVDKGKKDQTYHAMKSLKNAMKWDEDTFGREYDLDVYMIVAVGDFNMGAMENKGLNVFNTKYVLANNRTATDDDFLGVESVIGHEYFHNWTGNRITCRDWFQLSLKEGLTVFRDQEFSSDLNSRALKRIEDVQVIKSVQFAEDAGPMSHPIRPDSYIEMNNFYTVTVYNKGAEVIRMIHTLIGSELFRKGMDCYFERHDGQAVTCEDFVKAMEESSGKNMSQFRNWYSQSGTPVVEVQKEHYQPELNQYELILSQMKPDNAKPDDGYLHIPVKVGFINQSGDSVEVSYNGHKGREFVLELTEPVQTFNFEDVNEEITLSILRDFSAPVKLFRNIDLETQAHLFAFDDNEYAKWNAGQEMLCWLILDIYQRLNSDRDLDVVELEIVKSAFKNILASDLSPEFKALCLRLPSISELENLQQNMDVLTLFKARKFVKTSLANSLSRQVEDCYLQCQAELNHLEMKLGAGYRKLSAICLEYMKQSSPIIAQKYALEKFIQPENMTEELSSFKTLVDMDGMEEIAETFYERWQQEDLVIDKWFSTLAKSTEENAFETIKKLWDHKAMVHTNPNKVRALLGAFSQNIPAFHNKDGSGYEWYTNRVIEIDAINPQIASRLVSTFNRYKNYNSERRKQIEKQLKRIIAGSGLSKDVSEIVSKALA